MFRRHIQFLKTEYLLSFVLAAVCVLKFLLFLLAEF